MLPNFCPMFFSARSFSEVGKTGKEERKSKNENTRLRRWGMENLTVLPYLFVDIGVLLICFSNKTLVPRWIWNRACFNFNSLFLPSDRRFSLDDYRSRSNPMEAEQPSFTARFVCLLMTKSGRSSEVGTHERTDLAELWTINVVS